MRPAACAAVRPPVLHARYEVACWPVSSSSSPLVALLRSANVGPSLAEAVRARGPAPLWLAQAPDRPVT